jgi:hypothetical protein
MNLTRRGEEEQMYRRPEVAFCFDAENILSEKYGGNIRHATGATGREHLNQGALLCAMRRLYWFKTYKQRSGLERRIGEMVREMGLFRAKQAIKQTLFTVDGVLLRCYFGMSPELPGLRQIETFIAEAFRAILESYYQDPSTRPRHCAYTDLVNFTNQIKSCSGKPTPETRMKWIHYHFENRRLREFFRPMLDDLHAMIIDEWSEFSSDYTLSQAWLFRVSIMSQKRTFGYLPTYRQVEESTKFRWNITMEDPGITEVEKSIIFTATKRALRVGGVPRDLFIVGKEQFPTEWEEALSKVRLPVVLTASVRTLFSEAGKLEDMRELLFLAKTHHWAIPVRNLHSNEIVEFIVVEDIEEEEAILPIFWISYQIVLNFLSNYGTVDNKFKQWYLPFKLSGEEYEIDVMDSEIIAIAEQAKQRSLIKGETVLNVVEAVFGRMISGAISLIPEMKVGLTGTAHGWKFTNRLGDREREASWLYDEDGTAKLGGIFQYEDWVEATDKIRKQIGVTAYMAVADYTGFPLMAREVQRTLLTMDQRVKEQVKIYDKWKCHRFLWRGRIRTGFMMGRGSTKAILTALHLIKNQVTDDLLEFHGHSKLAVPRYRARKGKPYSFPKDIESRKIQIFNTGFG